MENRTKIARGRGPIRIALQKYIFRIMVELYLDATLHNQISVEHYREVLLNRGLDEQDQKLRSNLLKRVEAGTIQLSS